MTDKEWLDKFAADLSRLKQNREKVPLAELQTRYARAYNTLVAEVECDADWWAATYINLLVSSLPTHPEDEAGNQHLRKQMEAIIQEEKKPGGRFERYKTALTKDLDRDAFELLVWEIYNRLEREAYLPYWGRHCRWIGEPGKRWVYNDILKMYWCDPDRRPESWKERGIFKDGCWISRDWEKQEFRYPPPDMKED